MTKGEYRVGINFNPSADEMVSKIQRAAADLIDLIDSIDLHEPEIDDAASANAVQRTAEIRYLKELAQNDIEIGAMWAVKAATKPEPERPLTAYALTGRMQ